MSFLVQVTPLSFDFPQLKVRRTGHSFGGVPAVTHVGFHEWSMRWRSVLLQSFVRFTWEDHFFEILLGLVGLTLLSST